MQASLKLNTKNSQYILLTISNLQNEEQTEAQQPPKSDQYLLDSKITHSRITQSRYNQQQSDRIQEEQDDELAISGTGDCPTCSRWKQWALQQQKNMLLLEEKILQREKELKAAMSQLYSELETKGRTIQQYNQQLTNSRGQIARLTTQIKENQLKIDSLIKQRHNNTTNNVPTLYTTPSKQQIYSQRFDGEKMNPSTKMSLMFSNEKNGQTSTTATKNNFEWSAFQTNLQRLYKENKSKPNKEDSIERYLFENTMLKQYNSVLLERLKESKYRKPF